MFCFRVPLKLFKILDLNLSLDFIVVEDARQKLDKIWQWYSVKCVESAKHEENFEKCINDFNSVNI